MDDLRLIEDLGRDVPAWTDDDLAGARNGLLAEIAETAGAGTGGFRSRARWRRRLLGGLVGTAVAAAVGLLVLLATTVFVGSDSTAVPPRTVEAADRQMLLAAATEAASQPDVVPRPDQFLYISDGSQDGSWFSIDGTHDGLFIRPSLTGPGTDRIPVPGCRNGRAGATKAGKIVPGVTSPCTPDPAYLPDLPTDPKGLMAYLHQHYNARADDPNSVGKSVRNLVYEHYLRSAQWAALFRAFAQLPGLRVHQHTTDPAGHPAFGVSWSTPDGLDGELFFDPHTYHYTGSTAGKGSEITGPQSIVDRAGERP